MAKIDKPIQSGTIVGLLHILQNTRDGEQTCDDYLTHSAAVAGVRLLCAEVPDLLEATAHHLSICAECAEELQSLLLVLKKLHYPTSK